MEPKISLPPGRLLALAEHSGEIEPADLLLTQDACTIGRSPICQVIVRRPLVSRLHARIERAGPRYQLHDTGSANGTFVNGRRLAAPHQLADQDVIGLGSATGLLRFLDADPTTVAFDQLHYDERAVLFYLGKQPLELPPTQFRLLHHLYQHSGQVCTRESCAQAIWGRDYDPGMDADALDRIVTNLRSQIRQLAPAADIVRTRRGVGYELVS